MNRQQLLSRLDRAWTALGDAYAGLSDSELNRPGAVGDWSVKDILAHVTTWEEEALKYLPMIADGRRPPRYAAQYGGINEFNALMSERKRSLSPADVRRQLEETHRRLVEYVETVPEELIATDTRFRRRLRLDTYSHYPEHTKAISEWRGRLG